MQIDSLETLLKIILAFPLAICGAIFLYLAIRRGEHLFAAEFEDKPEVKLRNVFISAFYIFLFIACFLAALVFFGDLRMFLFIIPTMLCFGVIAIPFMIFGFYFRTYQYSKIFGANTPGNWDRNGNIILSQAAKQRPIEPRKARFSGIKFSRIVFFNAVTLAILAFVIANYLLSQTKGSSGLGIGIGLRLAESFVISFYIFGMIVACYVFMQIEQVRDNIEPGEDNYRQ